MFFACKRLMIRIVIRRPKKDAMQEQMFRAIHFVVSWRSWRLGLMLSKEKMRWEISMFVKILAVTVIFFLILGDFTPTSYFIVLLPNVLKLIIKIVFLCIVFVAV